MEPTKDNSVEWKKRVFQNMISNKIVLFGAGDEAKRFYSLYKDKVDIIGITANYVMPNMKIEEEIGIKVTPFDKEVLKDCFVVVAIDFDASYIAVERQLSILGLEYGVNFIDSIMADALLAEKKILVTAGDCLIDAVSNTLCKNRKFSEIFYVRHFYFLGRSKYYNVIYYRMCMVCDVYMLNYHYSDTANFYFEKGDLPEDGQVVYVTTPEFHGYWPQTPKKESLVNKYHVSVHGRPVDFTMRIDTNINKAIEDNISVEVLIEQLCDENYYSEEVVLDNYNASINAIKHMDEKCDIKLADYFVEQGRDKWLTKEYSHYQNCLLREISERLIKYLGYDECLQDGCWEELEEDILPFTEMPIYPSVAKILGLKFVNKDTKYKIRTYQGNGSLIDPYTYNKAYYGIEEVSFEEYIRRYYDYCTTARHLMEVW